MILFADNLYLYYILFIIPYHRSLIKYDFLNISLSIEKNVYLSGYDIEY